MCFGMDYHDNPRDQRSSLNMQKIVNHHIMYRIASKWIGDTCMNSDLLGATVIELTWKHVLLMRQLRNTETFEKDTDGCCINFLSFQLLTTSSRNSEIGHYPIYVLKDCSGSRMIVMVKKFIPVIAYVTISSC